MAGLVPNETVLSWLVPLSQLHVMVLVTGYFVPLSRSYEAPLECHTSLPPLPALLLVHPRMNLRLAP